MLWIVWSRWGVLVPTFLTIAVGVAKLATLASDATPRGTLLIYGLALAAIGGGGLFLSDRKIQEGSGYVSYDAQNDTPVVTEQSSGHCMFIPLLGWAGVFAVIGLGVAAVGLFMPPAH